MAKLINIGYGNVVNSEKIIAVVSPDSAPIKRMIQAAKDSGSSIDATQGRRTRSVIVSESNHIILSALLPDTIMGRFNEGDANE